MPPGMENTPYREFNKLYNSNDLNGDGSQTCFPKNHKDSNR